jgi:hypothetical protein
MKPTWEDIAQRLGADPSQDHQMVKCPAHEDGTASLAIGRVAGIVMMNCHAGCSTEDVVAAVKLQMSDLFPESRSRRDGRPQIVATYDYRDEAGVILYQSVRFEPKDFRQRRPKDGGGWDWKVKGVRLVPYRLPELLAADPADIVFIPEGEKDVDNLAKLGLLATCNVGGASKNPKKSKWLRQYNEHLRGRHLVTLPDNDEPGEAHASSIIQSNRGNAASVRILRLPNLPPKGDVSDWIKAGGTREQLLELAAQAPVVDAGNLASTAAAEVEPTELPPGVRNFAMDVDDEGEPKVVALEMKEVLIGISAITEGWPRRIGPSLFTHDDYGISWLESTSSLFGWLASSTGIVEWRKVNGCVTKEETYAELRRTAEQYLAVEDLPHVPPMAKHYYTHGEITPGNGRALGEFLDRFSLATDIDRDLLQAACMTMLWGGPGGSRPAIMITSEKGRGVGKSTAPKMIAHLFNGAIDFSSKDDIGSIKTRLLSAESLTKRMALLDNIKTTRFSWGELEAMITAPVISGHRMYTGESQRPNCLTWFLTLNGASLSKDMAQRCVIIKLTRPTHSGNWEDDTLQYISNNREAIIADIVAALQITPATLDSFSRWGMWERDVLARLPEPSDAQLLIAARQKECDAEDEEADTIEEFFAGQLKRLEYDPENAKIFIPSQVAARWWNWAMNDRQSPTMVTRAMNQMIGEGNLKRLRKASKAYGRGLIWQGEHTGGNVYVDLQQRLDAYRQESTADNQY